MHHIRNILFSLAGRTAMIVDAPILLLPTELLLHITSYLSNIRDICSLCVLCKTVQPIARRQLYRHVDTQPPLNPLSTARYGSDTSPFNAPQHSRLFLTLQKPTISPILTNLKLTLPECTHDVRSTFLEFWTGWSDWCHTLRTQIELALSGLHNLEVLDIVCNICPVIRSDEGRKRTHSYLENPGARRLRDLSFRCQCAGENLRDMVQTRMILSAPCLQSLKSLRWQIPLYYAGAEKMDEVDGELITDYLPDLERLRYYHNPLLNQVVAIRNIRHLECRWNNTPNSALSLHTPMPGLLFLVTSEDRRHRRRGIEAADPRVPLSGLMRGIKENPSAYHNLRHVGMFEFGYSVASASGLPDSAASLVTNTWYILQKTDIMEYMKVLIALPQLFSIQVKNNLHGQRPDPDYGIRLSDPWDENPHATFNTT